MKKLVALLISLILLLSCVPSSFAEDEPLLTFATDWSGGVEAVVATDSPYMQIWMEKSGIKVEAVTATDEQLAVSPVKPDIIRIYDTKNCMGSDVFTMIQYGELIALNDLIDEGYCPNYKAALDSTGDGWSLISNDEGIIPGFFQLRGKDTPRSFAGMIIRQDWLEELGLDMPVTIADWDNVLRVFREQKGARLNGMWGALDAMEYGFGVARTFYRDGDTIKFGPIEDNYELLLQQLNAWYADDVLDPDVFTENADSTYAKLANGEIGAIFGYTGSTFNKIFTMSEEVINGLVPAPAPVLSLDDPIRVAPETPTANQYWCYVISADCKNPKLAAQFLDWIYSEDGIILSNLGVEGITFEYDENGVPYYTEFVTNNPKGYSINEAKEMYCGEANRPTLIIYEASMITYSNQVQKDSLDVWNDSDNTIRMLPPLSFTSEENEKVTSLMASINTYVSENRLNFIYGNRSLDEFEAYRQDIIDMGIERVIEIYQAAYDRLLAR